MAFVIIYKESKEKCIRSAWLSFRAAIPFAAASVGLIGLTSEPGRAVNASNSYLLNNNDQTVILAKSNDPPSPRFGSHCSSGSAMSRSPRKAPSPPAYRVAPKVVDGPGNPGNPGNGDNPTEFDDDCPADDAKKEQKPKTEIVSYEFSATGYKKNGPRRINERFEKKTIERFANTALQNQKVKQEYERIKKRIEQGVDPIDIGDKTTRLPGNKV